MDDFNPKSSDLHDAHIMGARFDGLAAHIDVMGGTGTMVDFDNLVRPISEVMATVTIAFLRPETGADAVAMAQMWMNSDEPVHVQTFEDGSVKITASSGMTLRSDCLTSE